MTLPGFVAIWLLPALPFVSAAAIACIPWLRRLTTTWYAVAWPMGILGLGCLLAGLIGVFSLAAGLLLMLLGGAVSGFAMFSLPRADSDDGGDDGWRRPGDDPLSGPRVGAPIDWQLFDRLRREWESPRVRGR